MALPEEPVTMTANEFLRRFFDGVDGWVHLFAIDRSSGDRRTMWSATSDISTLIAKARPLVATSCIWFGVAPRVADLGPGHRGETDDCLGIPALWLDIDIRGPNHTTEDLPPTRDDGLELLADFPVPPSILVDTGGGYQAYWLLQELLPLDEAKPLLRRWGATWDEKGRRRGWHVDNVFDVARIMRLPASYNRKNDPVHVDVIYADWDRRYTPDDLDQWCIDPPTPIDTATRTVPYIGPERPGDAYNAVTDPGRVLEAVGWELDHIDRTAGDRHYRAPHHSGERGMTGATVYADGHTTIWSETFATRHQMQVKRPYDPFGLYTHIHHQGDWKTASTELAARGYGTGSLAGWGTTQPLIITGVLAELEDEELALAHIVDWPAFWAGDHSAEDWLAWPFIPRGRAVALYAPPKAGKSSVILAMVAALATGRPIFGQWPCQPTSVLYLDYEMTEADLEERLDELGFSGADDLTNLHYAVLPSLPPLDSPAGAQAVLKLANRCEAQVVIVDTFGRAVEGDENDADTVRAFYRHTGLALKSSGRAVLRTDHSGKDIEKGQRGTSAKADDVDIVWRLTRSQDGHTVKRTHSRLSWVPHTINLNRTETDGRIVWTVIQDAYPDGTKEIAEILDTLEVSITASAREAQRAYRGAGNRGANDVILAAQRWRQEAAMARFGATETPRNALRNTSSEPAAERDLGTLTNPQVEQGTEHPGTPSESPCGAVFLSLLGTPAAGPASDPDDPPISGTPKDRR